VIREKKCSLISRISQIEPVLTISIPDHPRDLRDPQEKKCALISRISQIEIRTLRFQSPTIRATCMIREKKMLADLTDFAAKNPVLTISIPDHLRDLHDPQEKKCSLTSRISQIEIRFLRFQIPNHLRDLRDPREKNTR
jgi:hypothetical protein